MNLIDGQDAGGGIAGRGEGPYANLDQNTEPECRVSLKGLFRAQRNAAAQPVIIHQL